MQPQTVAALLALNRQFYARFAGEFSRTRRSWPPGYARILSYLRRGFNVLDLGCGNGRLLHFLGESAWAGRYIGLDSSENLLAEATRTAASHPTIPSQFILADLFDDRWTAALQPMLPLGALVSLAVLHHIPGRANRAAFLAHAARLLLPESPFIVSTWQFMSSLRLQKRRMRWEDADIAVEDVEPGDHLVGWGEGSPGVRYCAAIDEPELKALAAEAGLQVQETFFSDGHEGNLNLYAVLTLDLNAT